VSCIDWFPLFRYVGNCGLAPPAFFPSEEQRRQLVDEMSVLLLLLLFLLLPPIHRCALWLVQFSSVRRANDLSLSLLLATLSTRQSYGYLPHISLQFLMG